MKLAILVGLILVAAGVVYYLARQAMATYLRYRGTRVITCPESRSPAAVRVDVLDAVVGALRGSNEHRLADCSRWPERQACGQHCLEQVEGAPEGCLVRELLEGWYRDKSCALCHRAFRDVHWHDHKPCLINEEGRTAEWRDFQPERLPGVLETHQPVCWDCHVAETFRRTRPDRVVDRDRDSASA